METDGQAFRAAIALFEGFELLDATGPIELLSLVPSVRIEVAAEQAGPVASAQGVEVIAGAGFRELGPVDLLLVPGGRGTRRIVGDEDELAGIRDAAERAGILASVCTGSAVLAAAGLLEGRRATSNKRAFDWVRGFGGDVEWVPEARWVRDGGVWTSSGVAAGMDMTVALIEELFGAAASRAAALRAEYEPHRDSGWDPFARSAGLV